MHKSVIFVLFQIIVYRCESVLFLCPQAYSTFTSLSNLQDSDLGDEGASMTGDALNRTRTSLSLCRKNVGTRAAASIVEASRSTTYRLRPQRPAAVKVAASLS